MRCCCLLANKFPCHPSCRDGFVGLRELCVLVALVACAAYGFDRLQRGIELTRPRDLESLPTVHQLVMDDGTSSLWMVSHRHGIARCSLPDLQMSDFVPFDQELSDSALVPSSTRAVFVSANLEGHIELYIDGRAIAQVVTPQGGKDSHLTVHSAVAVTQDGRMIVAATSDDTLHRWRQDCNELKYDQQVPGVVLERIELQPAGQVVAIVWDRTHVGLWNLDRCNWECQWELNHPFCSGLAWSPDGRQLASFGSDGQVCVWDACRGELQWRQVGDSLDPAGAAFSPCGRWLATGGFDKRVRLWDARRGTLVCEHTGHLRAPRAFAWSRDSRRLYSSGLDGTLRVWSVPALEP